MSSRQLRKLRKQQELLDAQAGEQVNSDESDDGQPIQAKPRPNAFAGFAALGSVDEMGESDDQEGAASPVEEPEATRAATNAKGKKPTKKKNKKKSQPAPAATNPEAPRNDGLDEIDRALEELKMSQAPAHPGPPELEVLPDWTRKPPSPMEIDFHHLKVENEMRRLFGRETIQAARAEESAQARPPPPDEQVDLETFLQRADGPTLSRLAIQRNPFIQGKETWPGAAVVGLSMALLPQADDECQEFAFTHGAPYVELENDFFDCVQKHDSMGLIFRARQNPYHISSILQVSRMAKQQGSSALSNRLVEQALFTFGRVTLSSFRKKLAEGRARMSFRRPENRQFWLAGYHYIRNLMPKGAHRTALEWAKVLLSISPKDEYAIINYVHALAIRAHEARWFIEICGSRWFNSPELRGPMHPYVRQTLVLALLQTKDHGGAREAIMEGISTVPWLYVELLSALNLDTPRSIWSIRPRDQTEKLYTQLYIRMTKDLWDNPPALSLLRDATSSAPRPPFESMPAAEHPSPSIARFVYLDNTPELMSLLPSHMLQATPNFEFDPLPPPEGENIFSHRSQRAPWERLPVFEDAESPEAMETDEAMDADDAMETDEPVEPRGFPLEAQRDIVQRLFHLAQSFRLGGGGSRGGSGGDGGGSSGGGPASGAA